jgi:hypothetical protein
MAVDNIPYKNHDSRVWENGEVVMKFTQIYVYIYILYIQCHNSPILFPSYPIKSLFTQIFGFVQHPQVSSAPWLENPPWLHLGDFPVPGSDVAWWIPGVPNVAMAIGGTYHI